MDISFDEYLKAAKVLANCSYERLPIVTEVLRQSGIDMGMVSEYVKGLETEYSKKMNVALKRGSYDKWQESDDETTLLLREEYHNGTEFTLLERMTGICRLSLYRYLWGERKAPARYAEAIRSAIDKIHSGAKYDN